MADDKEAGAEVDPISEAVRQWGRHGFGAISHMEVTTAINRLQQVITASINAELKGFDLTLPQYEALVLLYFSQNGNLPLSRMGQRLMVRPATVTSTVDHLEKKKFVERRPNETDRRSILAEITPTGRDVALAATEALVEIKYGISSVDEREAERVAGILRDFRAQLNDT